MTRRSFLSSETTGGPHWDWFLRKASRMNRAMGERKERVGVVVGLDGDDGWRCGSHLERSDGWVWGLILG